MARPAKPIKVTYVVVKRKRQKNSHFGLVERTRLIKDQQVKAYAVVKSKTAIPSNGVRILTLDAVAFGGGRVWCKARVPEAWQSSLADAQCIFQHMPRGQ